ncbi:MAG: flavin reductase family protein [Hyphomonas sp.]
MTTEKDRFRAAMAQLGSAVCVLTTDGEAGKYGITVSAVTSVSDEPPSLIVCVNRTSGANALIKANGRLCVNVLSCDQEDISGAFAMGARSVPERFETGDWGTSRLGNPLLAGTAASFDCEVDQAVEYGTHTVFLCRALHIEHSDETNCLIYHGRAYHRIRTAT